MNFTQNPIRTLVANDNILTRFGIVALLAEDKEIELVMEIDSCTELIALIRHYLPDVLLINCRLLTAWCNGYLGLLNTTFPFLKVIVISTTTDVSRVIQVTYPGLSGHLVQDMSRNELTVAIKTVHNGGLYYSKQLIDTVHKSYEALSKREQTIPPSFSDTEKNVLELCCKGYITKEIAGQLKLAPKTIEHYKERMILKTGCKNATSLAVYALINNIVRKEQLVGLISSFFLSNAFAAMMEETACYLI